MRLKVGMRVAVNVRSDTIRPGRIVEPETQVPGDHAYFRIDIEGGPKGRLTKRREIRMVLPDDDTPEALERWLAKRG